MEKVAELADVISRHMPRPGLLNTTIPRLSLVRVDHKVPPTPSVYQAGLCLIAQGSNRVWLGKESFVYDAACNLVVAFDLPVLCEVTGVHQGWPYLACKIDFDPILLAELSAGDVKGRSRTDPPAIAVCPSDPETVDAACRLVRLLDRPETIETLAPLIEREILYRLLIGPHGPMVRHLATLGSRLNQVSRAVSTIRRRFHGQIRIAEIAAEAGMSLSSLHAHFKAFTSMTPLDYQKELRLQEARRLMLMAGVNARTAGFTVGYESASQFSREYRRRFGAPPRQDLERLMGNSSANIEGENKYTRPTQII